LENQKIETPADGVSAGAWAGVNGLEIDAELRLAVTEVNPQGPEAEGDPAVPAIVEVAPGIGPTVTSAIERRPSVSSAIDPAAVTNSWLKSPNAPVTLQHALATMKNRPLPHPSLASAAVVAIADATVRAAMAASSDLALKPPVE
jgi:hypothetical protein